MPGNPGTKGILLFITMEIPWTTCSCRNNAALTHPSCIAAWTWKCTGNPHAAHTPTTFECSILSDIVRRRPRQKRFLFHDCGVPIERWPQGMWPALALHSLRKACQFRTAPSGRNQRSSYGSTWGIIWFDTTMQYINHLISTRKIKVIKTSFVRYQSLHCAMQHN
jgi:hypothetical protein